MYIPKANASLRVQTHVEIHSVAWSELVAVLKAYSSFREEFITHLELAYNLGHEVEVWSPVTRTTYFHTDQQTLP